MCKLTEILKAFTVTQWEPTHMRSTVIYYVETLGNNWHLKKKITSEKKRVVCPFWLSGAALITDFSWGFRINVIIHLEDNTSSVYCTHCNPFSALFLVTVTGLFALYSALVQLFLFIYINFSSGLIVFFPFSLILFLVLILSLIKANVHTKGHINDFFS